MDGSIIFRRPPVWPALGLLLLTVLPGCRSVLDGSGWPMAWRRPGSPAVDPAEANRMQVEAIGELIEQPNGPATSSKASGQHARQALPDTLKTLEKLEWGARQRGNSPLELSGWYLEFDESSEQAERTFRWRHDKLDQLLAADTSQPQKQTRLIEATEDESPFVRATGWIGLGRSEPQQHDQRLVELVKDDQLPLEIRRAAGETLARTAAPPLLLDLAAEMASRDGQQLKLHVEPLLYSELLVGLARDPEGRERLAEVVELGSEPLRVAALEAWADAQQFVGTELPETGLALLQQSSLPVRIAAIHAAGAVGDPRATGALVAAARDVDVSVRRAAIEALGKVGGAQAEAALETAFEEGGPVERAEVIRAWASNEQTFQTRVLAAAQDPVWQVRAAVADSLQGRPGPQTKPVLTELLEDPSAHVQLRAVLTLATWPSHDALPLLLQAARSTTYRTRQTALERLAEIYPEARPALNLHSARRRAEFLRQFELGLRTSLQSVQDLGSPANQ